MKSNGGKILLGVAALVLLVNLAASRPAAAQTSELFVSSLHTYSVLRYDGTTGAFIDAFVSSGSGELNGPAGMTFGPDGNLYVCSVFTDNGNGFEGRVLRYDGTTGAFIDTFIIGGDGGLNRPQNLAFGPDGNLYVCSVDSGHDYILRYDGTTGAFMDTFVPANTGGLASPLNLLFGPDANLYVASSNDRVLRYDGTTGAFLDTFVTPGSGGPRLPTGIAFDRTATFTSTATSATQFCVMTERPEPSSTPSFPPAAAGLSTRTMVRCSDRMVTYTSLS